MSPQRPALLLVEPHARTRLDRVARLRSHFTVHTLAAGEDPVRRIRRERLPLVLLALPRGTAALEAALRTARVLKTDRRPPTVALTDRWGRLETPADTLTRIGAEGYLVGRVEDDVLMSFLEDVQRNPPVVLRGEPERGLLSRLWRS